MSDELTHEEITARFLESGAVNFDAMGKFVGAMGPDLASRDGGAHGVILGWFNQISCFLPADGFERLFGGLRNVANVADAVDVSVRR